ncbi:alpha-hydroxy-acid oxidizing protein [Nocardioides perillae]|uniref:Isopentenyl diphosphate isomerase/L-lactate dehydrogenase-like FMN-dependent dehydrogenase n=1 Tax=Nocardioides perillae TaxID=1119534 RepID=A0A7Y9UV59_9ACTN|nr:alpha-hydroxy-acid oxidizing protein [Nocardioides perillae]NYG55485.1 isopentenyl diphosphate isomerase/L-lactate dehydrogenase-like FMN-dependent dehydrogenase [Nocardioides perillae]
MTEHTRRQVLAVGAATAAAALLPTPALAAPRVAPLDATPVPLPPSPLPVGPGAPFGAYQSEIYVAGMGAGIEPIFTTDLSRLESAAGEVLSEDARRHLLAWAGGAAAVRANARALAAWRIVPRMFVDRGDRDLTTTVLGVTMPAPVVLGPVGRQALAHPDGEVASARAAAGLGLTYVHSSQASRSLEEVAVAAPAGPRWFGLDWPGAQGPDPVLLTRARATGCTHLLLSPPRPGQTWAPLAAVRQAWDGPVVLGGVQDVPTAREAARRGLDGVVVSNERGRRGPGVGGTADALPRIADAVGGRLAVLFGSGVRTGTDVYRALALGAQAVLVGRPYVHGLALGAEAGVRHVLRTLLAETEITVTIAGVGDHRDLEPSDLVRA